MAAHLRCMLSVTKIPTSFVRLSSLRLTKSMGGRLDGWDLSPGNKREHSSCWVLIAGTWSNVERRGRAGGRGNREMTRTAML